jgi:hypothetical protein
MEKVDKKKRKKEIKRIINLTLSLIALVFSSLMGMGAFFLIFLIYLSAFEGMTLILYSLFGAGYCSGVITLMAVKFLGIGEILLNGEK